MTTSSRLRHTGTALAHSVAPATWRRAFGLRPADAIYSTAIKVGLAATFVLVLGGLLGHYQLAGIAALGALTSAFGRYQPYRRLAVMLGIVGGGLLLATAIGAFLGGTGVAVPVQILLLSVVAGLAAHLFAACGISGPGAVILVFAAAAGSSYTHSLATLPWPVLAMAAGVVTGWLAALAPALWAPLAPARLACARALTAVARQASAPSSAAREQAHTALDLARDCVSVSAGANPRTRRTAETLHLMLDEARTVVAGHDDHDAVAPARLDRLAGYEARLRKPWGIPGLTGGPAPTGDRERPPASRLTAIAAAGLRDRSSLLQSLRMMVAATLAGWCAVALGLEHPLWASMGAVAALQGLSYAVTVQRAIQRLLGNIVGAGIALLLLSWGLSFWPTVAIVIVLQMLAELLVMKNYTLTTIAVTPMALLMTGLGAELGSTAALSRVADTLLGVAAGVVVAALSISRADRHHVPAPPDTAAAA